MQKAYPGSWLSISQISMFIAQSGPISISLVALSTIEFTISAPLKFSDPLISTPPKIAHKFRRLPQKYSGDSLSPLLSLSNYSVWKNSLSLSLPFFLSLTILFEKTLSLSLSLSSRSLLFCWGKLLFFLFFFFFFFFFFFLLLGLVFVNCFLYHFGFLVFQG